MAEIVDQSQLLGGTGAGFGEFDGMRYRGQGFIPDIASLTAIEFDRNKGSYGIKIFLYAADSDSIPTGGEIYSWEVANGDITGNFQKFTLPVEQTLTIGNRYCFYIAPWDTSAHEYHDDYQDADWKNANVYSDGKAIQYFGGWSVSDSGNLDMHFQTYGNEAAAGPTGVKTINDTVLSNIKSINDTLIANIKTING